MAVPPWPSKPMLPLTPLRGHLLLLLLYLVDVLTLAFVSVELVHRSAAMFQVLFFRPGALRPTNTIASASATPSTLASQRNKPAKSPPKIPSPAPIPLAVHPPATSPRVGAPAQDATQALPSEDPTPRNSRRNSPSGTTMSPAGLLLPKLTHQKLPRK